MKHEYGKYCYIWDEDCEASLNCDNRCHRYDKDKIESSMEKLTKKLNKIGVEDGF